MSTRQWVREVESIWNDKKRLMSSVQPGGLVCWSAENESVDTIRAYCARKDSLDAVHSLEYRVTADSGAGTGAGKGLLKYEGLGTHDISSRYAHLMPYREAFGAAIACLECVVGAQQKIQSIEKDIVADYEPPRERFAEYFLDIGANGARLIADTYKAIPHCVNFVCDYALSLPAQRRIVCISAMHPLWVNSEGWYRDIAKKLSRFDEVYFIGPEVHYNMVKAHMSASHTAPFITHINENDYDRVAKSLREQANRGTVIVVKAAGRYHADRLVSMIRA
jgi:UDP-N-acetylmuramyl pentapeptide synthase